MRLAGRMALRAGALVALCLLFSPALCHAQSAPLARAPEFSVNLLGGEPVVLRQQRGYLVFLSFFAQWCGPCREEAPLLNELASRYPTTLHVYAIGYQETDPAKLRATAKDFGLRVPVVVDGQETLTQGYGVTGLPTGFLVDEYGYIRHTFKGISKESEALLRQSIKGRSKQILRRREKGPVVFIDDFGNAPGKSNSKEKGASVAQALRAGVAGGGIALAPSREEATLLVEGTVSDLGPIVGVELVLREKQEGRELERARASVINGDAKGLVKTCLRVLGDWK